MLVRLRTIVAGLVVLGLTLPLTVAEKPEIAVRKANAVLWRDPQDITSRDLFYGPGGEKDQPHAPFTFVKEDLEGTNAKFVVRDRDGVEWKVKMGVEARPETVATRLVWAVGYAADEDYFLPEITVANMPRHLHRGQKYVKRGGSILSVRLKREDTKKIGIWKWRDDPFTGTRELNGLRVMMAVLNNWDQKDKNNAIHPEGDTQVYLVSDLGSSFGATGLTLPLSKAKGNLKSYSHSKFIRRTTATTVDFAVPSRPALLFIFKPRDFFQRIPMRSLGRNIPRADARWVGDLLSRLSDRQIQDAFRAAGYSPEQIEGFSKVVKRRVAMLSEL